MPWAGALTLMAMPLVCSTQAAATRPPKETSVDRVALLVSEWTRAKTGIQEYIDAMPEDGIRFKPTPEIRSFAEQMLHIAGLSSAQVDETVEFFKMKMSRSVLLGKALEHHAHHRGQTTIYLRLKGVTPPSERLF